MSEKQFEALRAVKLEMSGKGPIVKLSDEELKAIVGGKDDPDPNSSGTSSGAGCDNTRTHCHYIAS